MQATEKLMRHPFYVAKRALKKQVDLSSNSGLVCAVSLDRMSWPMMGTAKKY